MKIDIQPKERLATPLEKEIMEVRGLNALYVFMDKLGKEETVQFDNKSLEEFQRNKTVSEMITDWKENYERLYREYTEAVKTNIHPIWTCEKREMHPITNTWTGKTLHNQPLEMTREQKNYFKSEADRIKNEKMGEIEFVKIVLKIKK